MSASYKNLIQSNQWDFVLKQIDNGKFNLNNNNGELLIFAVNHKNIEVVKQLLDKNITIQIDSLNVKSGKIQNALLVAIQKNNNELVDLLLPYYFQWGTKVENDASFRYWQKDHDYSLSYHVDYAKYFAMSGNKKAFDYLLKFNPQIIENIEESDEQTIVINAVAYRRAKKDFFDVLVENNFNVLKYKSKMLETAIENSNIEVLEWLIKKNINISEKNNYWIIKAAKYNSLKILKLLEQHGANFTETPDPLIKAIEYEKKINIEYLWNRIKEKTPELSKQVFELAIKTENAEIINIFLQHTDVSIIKNSQKEVVKSEIHALLNNHILNKELIVHDIIKKKLKI